jgi:hypothetical protein
MAMATFTSGTFSKYASKWLIGTGVFELLLAAGMGAAGVFVSGARSGLLPTAAILGAVGFGLVWFGLKAAASAERAARIEQTGLPGRATIVGLTQTGMFLNDNPQVRLDLSVEVPGRGAYQASHKEFVPLILLGRLAAGAVLPVKVDQADPSRLIIEWDQPVAPAQPATGWFAPAGAATASPGGGAESMSQIQAALQGSGLQAATPFTLPEQGAYTIDMLRAHLRANGLDGWASIDQVQDSGKDVGDDHLYVVTATVHAGAKPPYTCPPSATMVPRTAMSKIGPGLSVPIKVDPTNPDLFMFLWDKI